MEAGKLNRRITIERRDSTQDEAGQPVDTWLEVVKLWANPAGETGLGALRASTQPGVPSSIARYSFMVRRPALVAKGVDAGMRVSYSGMFFDIKLITYDLKDLEKAYLVCEQGGSNG